MKILSAILSVFLCVSCSSNNKLDEEGRAIVTLPNQLGSAICIVGNCISGEGIMQSSDNIEIGGFWENGQPSDGIYAVNFDGHKVATLYKDGKPINGLSIFGKEFNRDYFIGKFSLIEYLFLDKSIYSFDTGSYYFSNGAVMKGRFIFLPSMGSEYNRLIYKKHPDTEGRAYFDNRVHTVKLYGNLVFVGEVHYKNKSEMGIYAQRDYIIGTKFRPAKVKDGDILAEFKKKFDDDLTYLTKLKDRQRQKDKEAALDINWGIVTALGAGLVLANKSQLSSDRKADFLSAYSKDVMSGSIGRVTNFAKKYKDSRSINKIFAEATKEFQRLNQFNKITDNRQVVSKVPKNHKSYDGSENIKVASTESNLRSNINYKDDSSRPIEKPECKPINEHGVSIPTAGIPKEMWCYRYTYERRLNWNDLDIKAYPMGLFGYESGSLESAIRQVKTSLSNKATKSCKADGYSGIYDNSYRFNELIRWSEVDCEEKFRMGTKFHFCRGKAIYRCGVSIK